MERIKLNAAGGTIQVIPVGAIQSIEIPLEEVINAIQFSGSKYISIKGKLFLITEIAYGINDGGTFGVAPSGIIGFSDFIKSVKTYGLQNVTKVGNSLFPTRLIELL